MIGDFVTNDALARIKQAAEYTAQGTPESRLVALEDHNARAKSILFRIAASTSNLWSNTSHLWDHSPGDAVKMREMYAPASDVNTDAASVLFKSLSADEQKYANGWVDDPKRSVGK